MKEISDQEQETASITINCAKVDTYEYNKSHLKDNARNC